MLQHGLVLCVVCRASVTCLLPAMLLDLHLFVLWGGLTVALAIQPGSALTQWCDARAVRPHKLAMRSTRIGLHMLFAGCVMARKYLQPLQCNSSKSVVATCVVQLAGWAMTRVHA